MQRIIFIILISLSVLFGSIILYKLVTKTKCDSFNFIVPSNALADQKVYFYDSTIHANSWIWDFGDGSEASTLQNPTHTYSKAGKYIVKLIINNKCDDFRDITIEPKPMNQLELAHIQGPSEAMVGQSIKFTELTENASTYEWLFSESGKVDSREKTPSYIFKSSGYKTVTVYVTTPKGRISGTLTLNVKDKDIPTAAPAVIAAPVDNSPKFTTQEKKNLFTNGFTAFLLTKDDNVRQSAMEKFKPFICGADAPVFKNGKEAVGIMAFCKDLQNRNKACKVKAVNIDWNEGSDCLKAVRLEYKEK